MMTAVTQDARGGWAMPGSAADQDAGVPAGAPLPPTGAPSAPGPGSRAAPAIAAAPDAAVPRVALRPMTVADVLDGAFAVIKARPRKILGLTAGFVVPISLAAAYVRRDAVGIFFSDDGRLSGDSPTGGPDLATTIALLIVPSIALVCVSAALAHLVSGWSVGRDAPVREMLGVVGRRWWPLLASFVVVHLAEIGGAFGCYIGALFVVPLFVPVAPIIGTEGASAGEALRRSVRLVRARYWPVMGLAVLMGVVSLLLGQALASLPRAIALGLESWPLLALGSILSQVVTTPFVAAATVLLYLDLRVRTEGLDLEIAARETLDRAA